MSNTDSLNLLLAGPYQLEKCLSAGTETETWLGRCLNDSVADKEREVIIKLLHLGQMADWKQLELFQREAQTLRHLKHPRIPRLLDDFSLETAQGLCYGLVTERISGQTLVQRLKGKWLPTEADCIELAGQVLEILNYLHRFQPPVVHRDIKPSNLMLDDHNRLFMIDFGAVQDLLWLEGCGGSTTVGYIAPEQHGGIAGLSTDLYGLGATLIHLLSGRHPAQMDLEGLTPRFEAHLICSPAMKKWLKHLLAGNPADRYSDAKTALEALQMKRVNASNLPSSELRCLPRSLSGVHVTALAICCDRLALTDLMPDKDQALCRIEVCPTLASMGNQMRQDWKYFNVLFWPLIWLIMVSVQPEFWLTLMMLLTPGLKHLPKVLYYLGKLMDTCVYPLTLAQAPVEIAFNIEGLTLRQRCDLFQPREQPQISPKVEQSGLSGWNLIQTAKGSHFYVKSYLWNELQSITLKTVRWLWGPNKGIYRLKVKSRHQHTSVCFELEPETANSLKLCLDNILEAEKQAEKIKIPKGQVLVRRAHS